MKTILPPPVDIIREATRLAHNPEPLPDQRPTRRIPAVKAPSCGIAGQHAALTLRGYGLEIVRLVKEGALADAEAMLRDARMAGKSNAIAAAMRAPASKNFDE